MRSLTFGIYHSAVVLAVLLLPQAILIRRSHISLSVNESIGLVMLEVSVVLALELTVISISNLLNGKLKSFMQSTWAAILIPVSFIALVDYKFIEQFGDHPTPHIVEYGLNNIVSALSVIASEMTTALTVTLLAATAASAYLIYATRRTTTSSRRRSLNLFLTADAVVLLVIAGATSCELNSLSPQTARQIQKTPISLLTNISPEPFCPVTYAQLPPTSPATNATDDRQINRLLSLNSSAPPALTLIEEKRKKNVVVVVMESIRADQTTAYNPELLTTPFLAQIAQQGIKAENAYVDFAYTSKSLVSIHCGIPPSPTSHITESSYEGIAQPCLADLLKPLGYQSAFFQTATKNFESREQLVQNLGFDEFTPLEELDLKNWQAASHFGYEERAMLEPMMDWVDQQHQPFLLSVLTLSGHYPNDTLPPTFPTIDLDDDLNYYLNTIRYVDSFLYEMFVQFHQRGLLENTIFVITSDHGNHYGTNQHFSEPTEATTRVPLLIWDNGSAAKPKTVTGLRQHTDILPTIADLLDSPVSNGPFYGTSLLKPTPNSAIHLACKLNNCLVRLDGENRFVYGYHEENIQAYQTTENVTNENNTIERLSELQIASYIAELEEWKRQTELLY